MTGQKEHARENVFRPAALQSLEQGDAVMFGRERLGFIADEQQERVLQPEILRGLLNCTRHWGKSTVVAVKAVHHAFTQASRLVAGK